MYLLKLLLLKIYVLICTKLCIIIIGSATGTVHDGLIAIDLRAIHNKRLTLKTLYCAVQFISSMKHDWPFYNYLLSDIKYCLIRHTRKTM